MIKKIVLALIFLVFVFGFGSHVTIAQTPTVSPTPTPTPTDNSNQLKELQGKISELQTKLTEVQGQAKTLSSQISVMDSQVKLTELRIDATKRELLELEVDIDTATKKIVGLENSLDDLMEVLLKRIVATYQVGTAPSFQVILSSGDVENLFKKLNYLRIAQIHDKKLIYETQQAKTDYANQKQIFEGKKEKVASLKNQLDGYVAQLDQEKKSRESLLEITKNDERKYQDLLSKARAEYEAIQGIVAGRGREVESGPVGEGDVIASVISGASCNSGGTHLHFIVTQNGANQNPFNHLSSISSENCSGSSCGSSDGDAFNPSGSWIWPLDGPIKLTQGYGPTWATRNTWVRNIYSFHNGIDFSGSSLAVKAVKEGTLFRGSYSVGCPLRYAKVVHSDGFVTYYLHVN